MLKKSGLILILISIAITYFSYTYPKIETLDKQYGPSVFQAWNYEEAIRGTAFKAQYRETSFYLTNAHICNKANMVLLQNKQFTLITKVVRVNFRLDLCMLQIVSPIEDNSVVALEIADNHSLMPLIYTIGYPGEDHVTQDGVGFVTISTDITFDEDTITYSQYLRLIQRYGSEDKLKETWTQYCTTKGTNFEAFIDIDEKRQEVEFLCMGTLKLTLTNFRIIGGASGSPVFDFDNKIIGIINSSNTLINTGNFIPLDSIKEFLQEQ